jgi:hypothetical protein
LISWMKGRFRARAQTTLALGKSGFFDRYLVV